MLSYQTYTISKSQIPKTMKTILSLCFVFVLTACAFGIDGSGKVVSETRTVEKFNGVELKNAANVYITQGETQEVKIEAEDNIIRYITTEVKNNELIIDCKENINSHEPVNVYITVKELCLLELSGSGNMVAKNEITCEHMTLRLGGSGELKVALKSQSLKATLSGSGNMNLSGSVSESDLRINGSGNVNAQQMKTFTSSVSISGSGNTKVDVNNELNVHISGSGNVLYVTEPAKITTKITGSGGVLKI
jgi:hypothetical protein